MFHHIFDSVMAWFSPKFCAEGLHVPHPGAWSSVSRRHLKLMHSVMANLHSQLEERYVDVSKLPFSELSWVKFLDKTMLDDECVDLMASTLCQAVGSTMGGVSSRGSAVSPLLQISAEHASSFFVLGVMHAESLRRSGLDNDIAPILRILVGKHNVEAARNGQLDPLHHKDLLVLQTKGRHTSLLELARPSNSVTAAKSEWSHCIYDSLNPRPTLDTDLHKGIRLLLDKTGLKHPSDRIKRTHPKLFIKQKDSTVCGLMTFIRLVQKLTGEVLEPVHWDLFVDLVRVFFDIWMFYLAESKGAIRPGCLSLESSQAAGGKG